MANRNPGIFNRMINRITRRDIAAGHEVAAARDTAAERQQPAPPQVVVHKIIGQLRDQKTKAPLAGFTVRVFDLDADKQPKSIGYDITDFRGLFTMVYTTSRQAGEGETGGRKLRLRILDRQSREIAETDLTIKLNQKPAVVVPVKVPDGPAPPSPTIEAVAKILKLEVPRELVAFFKENQIRTLEDLRKTGSLANLKGLPDASIVRRLEPIPT